MQVRRRYEKVVRFVEEKPVITLDAFLRKYPESPKDTYYSTLNKLRQQGLLERKSRSMGRVAYRRTSRFSVERAVDAVRKTSKPCKVHKRARLEDVITEAVRNIVDPATNLTFAQMEIKINVIEGESGLVEILLAPSFCPMAVELAKYVENATSQIEGVGKTLVCCCGYACKDGDFE
jgi:metal-sulfur cluster biosynthetic enzyme